MVYFSFPRVLCVFAVFHKGFTALVQTQPKTTGLAGDQVCLHCQLMEPKDVLQITWQKVLPDGEKNVATLNKYFGSRVDPDFSGQVEIKDAGLHNSSIVIRELTEQDEGCYRCLFNTYPEGAFTGTTCLQVHKLFGPFLRPVASNSTEELIVSCSASGRPAPTVTIIAPQRDFYFIRNESASFTNDNRTVTVTKTAVLSRLHDSSTGVSCAAQVPSIPQKEVFMMFPEVKLVPTVKGSEEESEVNRSGHGRALIIALLVLLVSAGATALIFCCLKQKKQRSALHSVFEMNETIPASVRVPLETEASVEDTSSVRQQTPGRNEESINLTPSSL